MPLLAELYVATRTRNTSDADTENLPVLVVKRDTNIVFTKPLFGGDFRMRRGAGAVRRFDVREVNLDSADLRTHAAAARIAALPLGLLLRWAHSYLSRSC
jgi:hypothetical protein